MANLPEKNIVTVSKVTSIPSNTNVFINANGEFVQASINDVVKASNVVSDATLNAVKEAIDNQFDVYSGKSILATTSGGYTTDFTSYGASSQKQYSGKNLLNCRGLSTTTINGVTFAPIYDNNGDLLYVNTNGTASSHTQFLVATNCNVEKGQIISGSANGGGATTYEIQVLDSSMNYAYARDYGNGASIDTTDTDAKVCIMVRSGATLSNVKFYPMISVQGGEYEPYVGGVASPNPTYPQEILSNGHRGYYDGELLQGQLAEDGTVNTDTKAVTSKNPIPCNEGDTVKLIYDKKVSAMCIGFFDKSMSPISRPYGLNVSEYEYVAPANAKYVKFDIRDTANITPQTAKHICVTINGMYALIQKHVNKNFLTPNKTKATWNGIDYTPILNNSGNVEYYSISGTRTDATYYNIYDGVELPNGIEAGKTYKIGCHSTNTGVTLSINERVNGNYVQTVNTTTEAEWTPKANSTYTIIRINVNTSSAISDVRVYPMIRLAEVTDDTYVPHEEQTTYIPIAEPLRGIGEVKDSAKKVEGLYDEGRKVKEVVFDGSDDEVWTYNVNGGYAYIPISNIKTSNKNVLSTHYKNNGTYGVTSADFGNIWVNNIGQLIIVDNRFTSLAEWKANLQAKPIKVVYELAQETFTPFADQTPFYSMKTFDGVTLISSDAEMEVEVPTSKAGGVASIGYAKGNLAEIEMQNIKTKLVELQTAVVSA